MSVTPALPLRWLPAVVFALTGVALFQSTASTSGVGTEDIDVAIVDTLDVRQPRPRGPSPLGAVDVAEVTADGFRFAGWAKFSGDVSLVLETTATDGAPRIRARSLARTDVAEAFGNPELLYSGYILNGTTAEYGIPTCLYVTNSAGSRVLWESNGTKCR